MINIAFLSEVSVENKTENKEYIDDVRAQNRSHREICLSVKHIDKTKEQIAH